VFASYRFPWNQEVHKTGEITDDEGITEVFTLENITEDMIKQMTKGKFDVLFFGYPATSKTGFH
jgi:hypothetical protein